MIWEKMKNALFGHAVPQKGVAELVVDQVCRDLDAIGYKRVVAKTDGENPITALFREVKLQWRGELVLEESPLGDSNSNGAAEAAVKVHEGMVRTHKIALEKKIGKSIEDRSNIFEWICEWAALVHRRYKVSDDGRTAYERIRGKKASRTMVQIGENVWFKAPATITPSNTEQRFDEGIVVGIRETSDEILVWNSKGIHRSRTIRRRPEGSRWSADAIAALDTTPMLYNAAGQRRKPPGEECEVPPPAAHPPANSEPVRDAKPRATRLDKDLFAEHGYTKGCPGCISFRYDDGIRRGGHSAQCRKRMEALLARTPEGRAKVARAEERVNEYHGKILKRSAEEEGEKAGEPAAAAEGQGQDPEQVPASGSDRWLQRETDRNQDEGGQERKRARIAPELPDPPARRRRAPASETRRGEPPGGAPEDSRDTRPREEGQDEVEEAPRETKRQRQDADIGMMREVLAEGCPIMTITDDKKDISEVYSPPRISARAPRHGLKGGFALDILTEDEAGTPWDFRIPEMRLKAMRLLKREKPRLLVGSPMCTWFSKLMALNRARMGEDKYQAGLEEAKAHIEFVCQLYREQIRMGGYILHEHPEGASSWGLDCIKEIMEMPGMMTTVCDMCCFGMTTTSHEGPGEDLVLKPTRWMSNCLGITKAITRRCAGGHRHGHLTNGRAKRAAIYPPSLCDAICKGLAMQLCEDKGERIELASLDEIEIASPDEIKVDEVWLPDAHIAGIVQEWASREWRVESDLAVDVFASAMGSSKPCWASEDQDINRMAEDDDDDVIQIVDMMPIELLTLRPSEQGGWEAIDDVKGGELDPEEVMKAREVEMDYVYKRNVYKPSSMQTCLDVTGRKPIKTGWSDTNKGDAAQPNMRSRLVAKEYKAIRKAGLGRLFAGTPPSESLRVLMNEAVGIDNENEKGDLQISIIDVRRAHFYAKAMRRVFVEVPKEDPRWETCEGVAELIMSLYGTQDAAANWEAEYTGTLVNDGFVQGKASGCHFYKEASQVRLLVHGDDFVAVGNKNALDDYEAMMTKTYECKVARLGWTKGMSRQTRILGRIVTLHDDGIDIEADPALLEEAIANMGLRGAKGCVTPAVHREHFEKMTSEELTRVRMKGEDVGVNRWSDETEEGEEEEPDTECQDELQIEGSKEENVLLDEAASKRYVSVAALLNYTAPDRPSTQFAVKECLRKSSAPTVPDETRLKRILRYLVHRPREVIRMGWHRKSRILTTYVDSDFAGCQRTRKSTAGGCACINGHLLKSWAKTIPVLALSTGEAELMSLVRGSTEALGLRAIYRDFGIEIELRIESDATAAIGIVGRLGLGKVRHLAVSDLWVQRVAKDKEIVYAKVPGELNPADAFTKALDEQTIEKHMKALGIVKLPGRAAAAPKAKVEDEIDKGAH